MKYVTALVQKNVPWIADATSSVRQTKASARIPGEPDLNLISIPASFITTWDAVGARTQARRLAQKEKKNTHRSRETHKCISIHIFRAPSIISDRPVLANRQRWEFLRLEFFSGSLFVRASVQIVQSHKVMAQVPMHSGHTLSERMENQAGFGRRWCASQIAPSSADLADGQKAGGFRG